MIRRFADPDAVAGAAAEVWETAAREAVERGTPFHVALAGGSTPGRLYRLLASAPYAEALPWSRTRVAFGDERCVPPDHEDSNYRFACETLLDRVDVPARHVLRMRGEQDPEFAARDYEERLRERFPGAAGPEFDLLLLGMGADGHTASLFPGTTALDEARRWVVPTFVPQLDAWRLTLTYPALAAARRVLVLVTGRSKARAFAEAFEGAPHVGPLPIERVRLAAGTLEVLTDLPGER